MPARGRWRAPPPHPLVHPGIDQTRRQFGVQQQMVDTQPRVGLPVLAEVIPEGIDALVRVARAQRIGPALCQQAAVAFPALGLQQRVLEPRARVVDVLVGRHHVEVAGQHHRMATVIQALRVTDQALEPRQLVVELRPGLRVAVRQVEAGHQHAVDGGFEVAAVSVGVVAGQATARLDRVRAPGEDGHAVPRLLPVPDGAVAGGADLVGRKRRVDGLQFLEAGHVGRLTRQPVQQRRQAVRMPLILKVAILKRDIGSPVRGATPSASFSRFR